MQEIDVAVCSIWRDESHSRKHYRSHECAECGVLVAITLADPIIMDFADKKGKIVCVPCAILLSNQKVKIPTCPKCKKKTDLLCQVCGKCDRCCT